RLCHTWIMIIGQIVAIAAGSVGQISGAEPGRRVRVGDGLVALAEQEQNVLGGTPGSGSFRRCCAYATWLPDCTTQSLFSMYAWIAIAPATVLVTGDLMIVSVVPPARRTVSGMPSRSGMFSLK